jgi:hypothetical protein
VFSDKDVTHEVQLSLLHLNCQLLAVIALICFGALPLQMGLVLPRVQTFMGIVPGLSTIVANAGWEFSGLGSLMLCLLVSRGLWTTMGKMVHQLYK